MASAVGVDGVMYCWTILLECARETRETQSDTWQSTQYANVVRHVPSGNYYARLRIKGKLIWRPHDTVAIIGYAGPGGSLSIPETINGRKVTSLGSNAFYSCTSLTSVIVPGGVTNIGDSAFQGCGALEGVYFQGNAPSLGLDVFTNDASATAYRFSNTQHWAAVPGTFGGLPTALWLTVNGGTDGGCYTNLQQVAITANDAGSGTLFAVWTGTTQYVGSVTSACTTVSMPAAPVTLTATYHVLPFITTEPASQIIISGSNTTFSVTAGGDTPLGYQWCFNGGAISGATASSHRLSHATTNETGNYTVVVTNAYGGITSSVATLTVVVLPRDYDQMSGQLLSSGHVRLSFVGVAGWDYALDRSFTLSPPDWVPQATNSADANGGLVFTNKPDVTTNNFWRIRSVP